MEISPAFAEEAEDALLLLEASETMREAAEVARKVEPDIKYRIFYIHLAYCFLQLQTRLASAEHASRSKQERTAAGLALLESLIPRNGRQRLPFQPKTASWPRLRALNSQWDEVRKQDYDSRVEFVRQWLMADVLDKIQNGIDASLEHYVDSLIATQPRDLQRHAVVHVVPLTIDKPPPGVWKAAQSVFSALMDCRECKCHPKHEFGAKLALGAYRQPAKKPWPKQSGRPTRKGQDERGGGFLDLNIFLALEDDHWREFRVRTAKESKLRWNLSGKADELKGSGETFRSTPPVKKLCEPIIQAKAKAEYRLVLDLKQGQLFEFQFETSDFPTAKDAEPISLATCLGERQHFFSDKIRGILSLILSYAVLHLHGTSWLEPGWRSSNIMFFQTAARKTPLRPFIQTRLPQGGAANAASAFRPPGRSPERSSNLDNEDLQHQCPELVALAVVLMEVHFKAPFRTLAHKYGLNQLIEEPSGRINPLDAMRVFYGAGEIEGCQSHIPGDNPLLAVIDNCLTEANWEDDEYEALDRQLLQTRIYEMVVQPLERHLGAGFKDIPLEDLDSYAQDLDFGNWGQIILPPSQPLKQAEKDGSSAPVGEDREVRTSSPRASYPSTSYSIGCGHHLQWSQPYFGAQISNQVLLPLQPALRGTNITSSMENHRIDYRGPRFFDDEAPEKAISDPAIARYRMWKFNYEKVYEKFATAASGQDSAMPVRVAILDTGIDDDHPSVEARKEQIIDKRNWYSERLKKSVRDRNGHGTFVANLVMDYAPDAHIYISKIADRENSQPDAHKVAKAIDHAVHEWRVDIICMSFGWPSCNFEGQDQLESTIDSANAEKVLMFAASSNSGGRQGRAYPASSPHVICIHSTDTYGDRSSFSPTASKDHINLATTGECVESAWPCEDEENPQWERQKSGTSYANAIAIGIGSFLLQYARLHLSPREALALKRRERMEAVLKRIAERGSSYATRDGYYYIELSLTPGGLFSKDREQINHAISDILTT